MAGITVRNRHHDCGCCFRVDGPVDTPAVQDATGPTSMRYAVVEEEFHKRAVVTVQSHLTVQTALKMTFSYSRTSPEFA
jgi:hypothetical protein